MLIITLLYFLFFSRHQQLTKLLRRYNKEPIHHQPRESPGEYYSVVLALKTRVMIIIVTMVMIITALLQVLCVCLWVFHTSLYVFILFLFSPVLYFWTLCFPTVSGAAILLIAAMMGGYGALTCGLLFPWLARSIFSQYHRMTTYQRFDKNVPCKMFNRKSTYFTVEFISLLRYHLSSFQVTKPNLFGNSHSWPIPFPALLLWKDDA